MTYNNDPGVNPSREIVPRAFGLIAGYFTGFVVPKELDNEMALRFFRWWKDQEEIVHFCSLG